MDKPKPPKLPDPLGLARTLWESGKYRFTGHADGRSIGRSINIEHIKQIIRTGRREKAKDEFKVEHNAWTYAIVGRDVDKRELRVVVAFEEQLWLLIVTVVDIHAWKKELR